MKGTRLLSALLSLLLVLPAASAAPARAAEEPKRAAVTLYCNLTEKNVLSGYLLDGVFYVPAEELCAVSGARLVSESGEELVFSVSGGTRELAVTVGSGKLTERLWGGSVEADVPSAVIEGEACVSAAHFLRWLGAAVAVDPDAATQMTVIRRYDVFDALAAFMETDRGHFFCWDEVDTGDESLEDKLVNAGIVSLLHREPNFLRLAFDARGVAEDAMEDALTAIVLNEGADALGESFTGEFLDLAGGLMSAESDWYGLLLEAYEDDSAFGKQLGDLFSNAADAASFAGNAAEAAESLRQFGRFTETQRELLGETLLWDGAELSVGEDSVLLAAARSVDGSVRSGWDACYDEALALAEATAYDMASGAMGAAGANPVSIAWNSVGLLLDLLPGTSAAIEQKEQLYLAYDCSLVQLAANEALSSAYADWYYGAASDDPQTQAEKLERVRQAMVLELKATLTARQALLRSGYLDEAYAAQTEEWNAETARLLNRAEGCRITAPGLFSTDGRDDLSRHAEREGGAASYLAELTAQYGFAQGAFAGSARTDTGRTDGGSSASTAWELTSGQTGLLLTELGDFDGNGVVDLLAARLELQEEQLRVVWETALFRPDGTRNTMSRTSLVPAGNRVRIACFVRDGYFVLLEQNDDSGAWIGSPLKRYPVTETVSIHHDKLSVYDLSGNGEAFGPDPELYVNKDFRGQDAVCYTVNTPDSYDALYARGFTLTSVNTSRLLAYEDEACAAVYEETSRFLGDAAARLSPVSWEERWETSFLPAELPDGCAVVELSASPSAPNADGLLETAFAGEIIR